MALAHCVGERWPAELARNLPFLVWGKLFRGRCLSGATRLHSCSGNSLGEVVAKGVHLCLALQEARTGEAKLQEQVTQKVADAVRGGHWRSSLSCKNQMQEEPTALKSHLALEGPRGLVLEKPSHAGEAHHKAAEACPRNTLELGGKALHPDISLVPSTDS